MITYFAYGWRGRVLMFVARLLGVREAGETTTGASGQTYYVQVSPSGLGDWWELVKEGMDI
jgi:hypothetical protein